MLVQCDKCHSRFEISDALVGVEGRKLRCSFCQGVFWVKPPAKPVASETLLDQEEEPHPELDGTMVLSLFHRPKTSTTQAPTKKAPDLETPKSEETPTPTLPTEERLEAGLRRVNLTPPKKAELLQKTGWFSQVSWDEIKVMAPYWELYLVPPNTTLFQPNDRNSNLGLVVKGEVVITDPTVEDPEEAQMAVLTPGKSLGELSFLDGQPRGGRAHTTRETYLFILSRKRADRMAEALPKVWRRILEKLVGFLCHRIRVTHGNRVDFLVP